MEALNILKFWRTTVASAGADVISAVDGFRNAAAFVSDYEETDDEDSFFDLVFKSPIRCGKAATKKDSQFVESARDVLSKPQSPVTTLRSAPRFKILMLGFRKSPKSERSYQSAAGDLKSSPLNRSNRFAEKCGAAAEAPPVFARDNSLRSKMLKERSDWDALSDVVSSEKPVPRYMRLIRPFYVKVSNKSNAVTPSSSPVNLSSPRKLPEGSRMGSFKIVSRNLGKSRSASAALGVAAAGSVRRRDDSLLEQYDGIQGAILHCKKSYNSSSREYSQLCGVGARNSCEEQKRCSI